MSGSSVLLDTSVVVRHFRMTNLKETLSDYEELYLPLIALGELYHGAYTSGNPDKKLAQIEHFLHAADVLTPDNETSRQYGRISSQLARDGTPIPQNDIWIAALAIQCRLPLATTDKHFRHVEGLDVLFW